MHPQSVYTKSYTHIHADTDPYTKSLLATDIIVNDSGADTDTDQTSAHTHKLHKT